MAKEKKRSEDKKKKKIVSLEAEIVLLGLLLFFISLIGLLNQGLLGNIITFLLVFLFGTLHTIPPILGVYIGSFIFIKRAKPKLFIGLKTSALITLILFLMIGASIYDDPSINEVFGYYLDIFNLSQENFYVDIFSYEYILTGGGFIGHILYTVIYILLGEIGTRVIIYLTIFSSIFVLIKDKTFKLIKKVREKIEKIKENRKNKKVLKISKEDNKKDLDVSLNKVKDEDEVVGKIELKKLTFDIFNEPLFDEKLEETTIIINNKLDSQLIEKNEGSDPTIDDESSLFNEEASNNSSPIPSTYPASPYLTQKAVINQEERLSNEQIESEDYNLLNDNLNENASLYLDGEAQENVEKINQKLAELNIKASVNNYIIGPCVTRYEIVPEIGVRVSSIVNIEDDLKLALAAFQTRMEAPIPGKSAVGIEVANKKRYNVFLKEVLLPHKDEKDKLLVAIGKDLNNNSVAINIDKMPHLLVAGATGSGKSVCINSMIVSLLLRSSPQDVRLLLIDPKKVEMTLYANMPHLLCPVIWDPKKASFALKKIVLEMDKRYNLFANSGVKNITSYNQLMKNNNKNTLYSIVVIIDELADLMMVASREVEESIQRITQLARAAGIYLIVATQRPSVDVITGIIKANIPSRIAFAVSSSIDSRTILDRGGAEQLLGKGDMLLDISGSIGLSRVQGALVSDEEISRVVQSVKSKYETQFIEDFINLEEVTEEKIEDLLIENTKGDDELYREIRSFVIRTQRASTSLFQRTFSLGYGRAARMIDNLEKDGVIGPQIGSKPRQILIQKESEE